MALLAKGVKISYSATDAAAALSADPIADVLSITEPPVTMGMVETTGLGDADPTFLPSIPEGKEAQFSLKFTPATASHAALRAAAAAGTLLYYAVKYPGSTPAAVHAFAGYIKSFVPQSYENQKLIQADVTIQVTGATTFTPASSG